MKKIFAISFLSVFAVVGIARANYYGYYASGTDADKNYNLASVNYVKGSYDEAVKKAKRLVVTSDKKTDLAGGSNSSGWAGSDEKAPTIKYMEDSIAEAVDGIDTSGLVDKAHVVNSQGNNWNDESVAEAALSNPDDYVATDGAVQYRVNQLSNQVGQELQKKVAKDDIVTLAEDAAAVAEMEAGTNDAKYDTVVPSYRTVYNALNLLEAETDSGLDSKVDIAQGEGNENAIMITNAAGNVIPAPVGDCANTTNKCALVTGVDENGNLALQWEVIARNVPQSSAGE
ncbi:MAG: hypothetical protein IKA73_03985 [Alphaproteobacteria bacterium]|nr:hypothetical protein [Alphaproteobacteria bacterium]